MKKTYLLVAVLFFCTSAGGRLSAQPERENYFPADLPDNIARLDPGDVLLAESILLTNRFDTANVSVSLSFDGLQWGNFALGPKYSSFFNMKDQPGCIARLITNYGPSQKIEKKYYLDRGHCYGIFWNASAGYWDIEENRCRR
ncbi:MAG: hypothetical protein AAF741_11605 [Bacteroidota bacterium]